MVVTHKRSCKRSAVHSSYASPKACPLVPSDWVSILMMTCNGDT